MDGKQPCSILHWELFAVNALKRRIWWMPAISKADGSTLVQCQAICYTTGSADSQLELPFSVDKLIALCILVGSLSCTFTAACDSRCLLAFAAACLIVSCLALVVLVYWKDCSMMRAASGAVIFFDTSCCDVASVDGFVRPPGRTDNAISSWVTSLKAFWPVREVRNFCLLPPVVVQTHHQCWEWFLRCTSICSVDHA